MDADGNMIQAKAVENLYRALIRRLEVGGVQIAWLWWQFSLSLSPSFPPFAQPLSMELAQSTAEVQEVGSEVEKLRQRVDTMKKEQEKLLQPPQGEEEQSAMLVDVHSPLPDQTDKEKDDKVPMLIDLMSDSPPAAEPMSVKPAASHDQSHDDLLGSSVEAPNYTHLPQSDILQPEILPQSQELFWLSMILIQVHNDSYFIIIRMISGGKKGGKVAVTVSE